MNAINKMKKTVSVLLTLVFIFTAAMPSVIPWFSLKADAVTKGTCGANLTWTLSDNGILEIRGTGDMTDYSDGSSPWKGSNILQVAVIGEGVTSISANAFTNCDNLFSVTMPYSLTSIGDGAFADCDNLERASLPFSLRSIGCHAFEDCCGITEMTIPNGITILNQSVFNGCRSLKSVSIPASVTEIDDYAFNGCGLKSVNIPGSVTRIGNFAFCLSDLESVTVPGSVKEFGEYAFAYCPLLESVTIGSGLTDIPERAFYRSENLNSVIIPDSVRSIAKEAFEGTKLYTDESNWENGVLYAGNALIKAKSDFLGACIVKSGTTCIADQAFLDCSGLTLLAYAAPVSLKYIGMEAFSGCYSLIGVTIPDGVKRIGYGAFNKCYGLQSASLPDSVEIIGSEVFADTPFLTNEKTKGNYVYVGKHLFYVKSTFWGSYSVNSGTLTIAGGAFKACTNITSLTVPDGVRSIGDEAFSGCSNFLRITIPKSVTYIGIDAFYGCSSLNISCYAGSYAEAFAIENGIPYTILIEEKLELKSGSVYSIKDGYITGIAPGTTVAEFKAQFTYTVTVKDGGGNTVTSGTICTGFTAASGKDTATAVVKGDANGDGEADSSDAALTLKYDAGVIDLSNIQLSASNVSGDSEADSADAAIVLKYDAGIVDEL